MKNFITKLGFITGLGAIGFGFYKFYQFQLKKAMNYCYKIASFQVTYFNKNKVEFRVGMKIQNKSSFALNIEGYEIDFYVEGKKLGSVMSNQVQTISNNGVSDIVMMVSVSPGEVLDAKYLSNLLLLYIGAPEKMIIELKGSLKAKMQFISVNLPVDLRLTMAEMKSTSAEDDKKKTKCEIS